MSKYIEQALEQCGKTATVWNDVRPISGKALTQGIEWLSKANVLRLDVPLIPYEAEERKIARLGEYGYGLDTPWPITAIEYEHGGAYDVTQDYTRALSTRRIALCICVSDAMTPGTSEGPTEGGDSGQVKGGSQSLEKKSNGVPEGETDSKGWGSLVIWPISYFDEKREWEFAPGAVIIPRYQGSRQMALSANQYLALAHTAEKTLRAKLSKLNPRSSIDDDEQPMVVQYQPMMPELCKELGLEHANKMIRESSMDALWVALGSFMAMGCANVFIDSQSRALTVLGKDGQRTGLDPFRGKRSVAWTGKGFWSQDTKVPESMVSDVATKPLHSPRP